MTDLIFSTHALKRMEERKLSKEKVEQIIECGKVYGGKEGRHVIKYTEIKGSIYVNYRIIFSKKNKVVITLYVFEKKINQNYVSGDKTKGFKKMFKNKKIELKQKDDEDYHNEELKKYNIK